MREKIVIHVPWGYGDKVLVVEDSAERVSWFRSKLPGASIATTKEQALEFLKNGAPFNLVFLDHDAVPIFWTEKDADEKTFYDVAKRLTELKFSGTVIIHSFNAAGIKRMESLLRHTADVRVMKFGTFTIT